MSQQNTVQEALDEIEAVLKGAHSIMETVSGMERRVGTVGSHARGYTHKITMALERLGRLRAATGTAVEERPSGPVKGSETTVSKETSAIVRAQERPGDQEIQPEPIPTSVDQYLLLNELSRLLNAYGRAWAFGDPGGVNRSAFHKEIRDLMLRTTRPAEQVPKAANPKEVKAACPFDMPLAQQAHARGWRDAEAFHRIK